MPAAPLLETDRLRLCPPGPADLDAMMAFLGDERSRFYGGPFAEGPAWEKFATYVGQWVLRGYGMFAVRLKDSGETVGMAGPYHPAPFPEPEMCWLLTADKHDGKGYASAASRAVLRRLFADLGWTTCVSYIDPANAPSQALARRLGALPDPAAPAGIASCKTWRHRAQEVAA